MEEEWRDIADFEGVYQISNLGRVKSLGGWRGTAKRKPCIRKLSLTKDGYVKVRLMRNEKDVTARIHRLVAEAFIPNPLHKETINHIDGNKQNNIVSNLEWCDRSEQMYHAYQLGLKTSITGINNCNAKLTKEQIKEIRKNYVKNSRTNGGIALGKRYHVSDCTIGLIAKGKTYKNIK